jgi:type IV secretion system protein VirB4
LAEATGLEDVVQSDRNNDTDFGESQMTIFVFNDSVDGLEKDVNRMSDALTDLGILAPRRDLRLEECYWMQLPANFSMVKRQKPLATALIGGYASLFNYPAGKRFGNHWGLAVTMFRTVDETPFFFNFHVGDNGHTSIIGPKGMGKTVMTNFMVSEARKFNGKIFFFDQESASKVFIKSIGGYYTSIDPETPSPDYAFNPFNIPDTPQNRKFLKEWVVLLAQMGGQYLHIENEKLKRVKESRKQKRRLKEFLTKDEAEHLESLVDKIYELPQEQRRLSSIAESFNDFSEQKLAEKMSIWHGDGKYSHLFDNDRKGIVDLSGDIYGFAVCDVVEDGITLGPILSYLFYRIEMLLSGEPTIIILDEAWSLVNNEIFAPKLEGWLQRLKEKNAIVIFATEAVPNDKANSVTNTITENIATKIFLPNPDASEFYHAYRDVWGLSENEYDIVSKIRGEKRQFMLKQSNDRSIVVELDLSGLKEVKILSGDKKTVIMMNESIEKRGDDPKEWLPELYEKLESRD